MESELVIKVKSEAESRGAVEDHGGEAIADAQPRGQGVLDIDVRAFEGFAMGRGGILRVFVPHRHEDIEKEEC